MDKQKLFKKFKAEHPDWNDEQVWSRVAIDIQTDKAVDEGKNLNSKDIWNTIITKARDWLKEVLPVVYEKVKEVFATIIKKIKEFVNEHRGEIFEVIVKYIGSALAGV